MPFIQLSNAALRIRLESASPSWIRKHAINIDDEWFVPHTPFLQLLKGLKVDDNDKDSRKEKKIDLMNGCKIRYKLPLSNQERVAKERKAVEYANFMQKFRDLQDEKDFLEASGSLLSSQLATTDGLSGVNVGNEYKTIQGQISGIVNVLFSVAAVFTAAFYLGEVVYMDVGARVLVALFAGLVVGVAEAWFFTRDLLIDQTKEG